VVIENSQIINSATFLKMARGDLPSLKELAHDFFIDIRSQLATWAELLETNNHRQLRSDLHRCKGGASLFGLERLVALIDHYEKSQQFDVATFADELCSAEQAIMACGNASA
jgi:HPt (histidine-containing phosphotransfer) domain-containing protein